MQSSCSYKSKYSFLHFTPQGGGIEQKSSRLHDHRVAVRLACQAFKISETCYRYDPKLSSENELIADWLLRLTTIHKQLGLILGLSLEEESNAISPRL